MTNGTATSRPTLVPTNVDLGLLILRVWLGISLAVLHGWGKVAMLLDGERQFTSMMGLPPIVSLMLAIVGEVFAALLMAFGVATRLAALYLTGMFIIVVLVVHGGALTGENSGETAFLYLAGFVTIVIAGPGRYAFGTHMLPSTDVGRRPGN